MTLYERLMEYMTRMLGRKPTNEEFFKNLNGVGLMEIEEALKKEALTKDKKQL